MENSAGTLQQRFIEAVKNSPKKPSQADLARACGVSPPSVNEWLNGNVKSICAQYLLLAADYLEVSPHWLAGISPNMTNGSRRHTVGQCPVDFSKANFSTAPRPAVLFERVTLNVVIQLRHECGQEDAYNYFNDQGALLFTGPAPDTECPF